MGQTRETGTFSKEIKALRGWRVGCGFGGKGWESGKRGLAGSGRQQGLSGCEDTQDPDPEDGLGAHALASAWEDSASEPVVPLSLSSKPAPRSSQPLVPRGGNWPPAAGHL